MAEPTELVPQIIAGILSGGAGAATSLLGVFRKTKKRIEALEELLGKEEPVKTGLFLTVFALDETLKKLKREVESWEDDPPKWAERLISRGRAGSNHDLAAQVQFEERIERTIRSYNERLSRMEDEFAAKIRRLEEEVERAEEPNARVLTREEYLQDSRNRAVEMGKIREQLATVNGLLRGVMSALGIIDPPQGSSSDPPLPKPPKLPPRPGR